MGWLRAGLDTGSPNDAGLVRTNPALASEGATRVSIHAAATDYAYSSDSWGGL